MKRSPLILTALAGALAVAGLWQRGHGASGNFVLIRSDQPVQTVEVAEISPSRLVFRAGDYGWVSVSRQRCLALLNLDAVVTARRRGWLRLADGQQFPGKAFSGAPPDDDVLVWNHATWFGRMKVPLDRIESVVFLAGAALPSAGEGDVRNRVCSGRRSNRGGTSRRQSNRCKI